MHIMEKVDKPWGYELIWAHTKQYVGKILFVKAGEALSLQYHEEKDETIYLHSGEIDFLVEEEGSMIRVRLKPGHGYRIKPGIKHRMIAIKDSEILEASTPELDDVVRLEDRYNRFKE
ncbi:MAG: cupin domain-containing protein [Acidobacteria bacterium]|nr:cupin domain-containing protein [Acidobacteriota bacterium]